MTKNNNDWGDRIAAAAKAWEGKNFRPGQREQCMNFVRHILSEVKHPLANVVTKKPVDGHWTGPALASSLAGRDLGEMITKIEDLEAGDIVFWNDTYHVPGFGPGTITHVGIALSNRQFIHRNTNSRPINVQQFGYYGNKFRCALRVKQEVEPDKEVESPREDPVETRTWANDKGQVIETREHLPPGKYRIYSSGGDKSGAWVSKLVPLD